MHPLKLANPVTVLKGGVGLAGTAIGTAGRQNARSEPAEPTSPAFAGPVPAEPPVPDGPPVDVVG